MKTYWIELRRSPLLWVSPVLAAIDLAAVFGRNRWWIGVWPEASAAAQIPALFFAPIAAAAAAWSAGRSFRRGIAEQRNAAARSNVAIEVAQLIATLTYILGAYGVGIAAAAVVTLRNGGPGFLWPSYLLLGAATIVSCTGIGHAAGRLWNASFAVPAIAGLSCFLLVSSVGAPNQLGFYLLSGSPARILQPESLIARIALAVALVVLSVCIPPRNRRSNYWRTSASTRAMVSAAAIAVAISAFLTAATSPVQNVRAAPGKPLCSNSSPRVCIWPEHRKYLPQIQAMTERLKSIPQGWIKLPSTFYEQGLRGTVQGSPLPLAASAEQASSEEVANDFEILEGNMWFVSPSLAGSIMQLSIPSRCREWDPKTREELTQAAFEIGTWLEYRANGSNARAGINGGPPGVDFDAIEKLTRENETVQDAWVGKRLATIREAPCVQPAS